MRINKCFGCTKRRVGCHSECPDYISFREKLDEKNEEILKNKKEENGYFPNYRPGRKMKRRKYYDGE